MSTQAQWLGTKHMDKLNFTMFQYFMIIKQHLVTHMHGQGKGQWNHKPRQAKHTTDSHRFLTWQQVGCAWGQLQTLIQSICSGLPSLKHTPSRGVLAGAQGIDIENYKWMPWTRIAEQGFGPTIGTGVGYLILVMEADGEEAAVAADPSDSDQKVYIPV